MFGWAGTGKTEVLKSILQDPRIRRHLTCTYTGKAALVLHRRGIKSAATIHSSYYRLISGIGSRTMRWELNTNSSAKYADLLAFDECSMVDGSMGGDIESFDKPILVVGDPFQLPPIKGEGYFVDAEPNSMLKEIHRQAEGNPIIKYSKMLREGLSIPYGTEESDEGFAKKVFGRKLKDEFFVEWADQILCGLHKTRRAVNTRVRNILGRYSTFPKPGDKLINLRNNYEYGILNGTFLEVLEESEDQGGFLYMKLKTEDGREIQVPSHVFYFHQYVDPSAGSDLSPRELNARDTLHLDFGNAVTVHKFIGSQANNILFLDDGFGKFGKMRDDNLRARWLYTGTTRASQNLILSA